MALPDSISALVANLHSDKPEIVERAQQQLVACYADRLKRLVCQRLHPKVAQVEPATGVVNSALNVMLNRKTHDDLDRDSLWLLLAEIVICKTYNLNRHHLAQRRDVRRNESLPEHDSSGAQIWTPDTHAETGKRRYRKDVKDAPAPMQSSIVSPDTIKLFTMGAQPDQAAIVMEAIKSLGELEPLARLFIKGCGTHEIAKRLDMSPKTVTRKLARVVEELSAHLAG